MADDTDTDNEETTSPLAAIIASSSPGYTTARAHNIAEEIYSGFKSSSKKLDESEDDYYKRLDKTAEEARNILRAAKEHIKNQRYNNSQTLFGVSAALAKPTRSGSFGESMGNMSEVLAKDAGERRKFSDDQFGQGLKVDEALNSIDQNMIAGRLAAAQKRRELNQRLATKALEIIGKETRSRPGGGNSMSPFGKIASDEGLEPGTPQFNARVSALYNADMRQRRLSAGVDVEPEAPEQKHALADQLGIPYEIRDPFEGLSTKGKQVAQQVRQREAEEYLKTTKTATDQARNAIQDMDRFVFLNKDVATGPWAQWWPGTMFGAKGQEMGSITAKQSRNLRVPGEGPMSNYDAKQLTMAAVSKGKGPLVNKNIANGMKALKSLQIDYNRFINDYYSARGHIVGAEQAWQHYVDDNPIFDPKAGDGSFVHNKNRLNYKQYFAIKNAESSDPDFAAMTDEEKRGATTPAEAEGGYISGYADGGEVERHEPKRGKYRNKLSQIQRALAQGASMNFSDELLASMSNDPYETAISRERGDLENLHNNDPVTAFTAEAAGALPGSVASVYLAKKGLERAGRSKSKVGKAAAVLANVLPKNKAAQMSLAGAGAGAVAGLGSSQEGSEAEDVGSGALVGALVGPLAGVATKYGVHAARAVKDFLTGSTVSSADRKIVQAVLADNKDLAQMATQVTKENRAGVPSNLADVGGRNVQALRDSIAARSGPGPDRLLDDVATRMQSAGERVGDRVNKALKPDAYFSKLEELKDALYTQAKPIYEQAYAENPAIKSDFLSELSGTKDGMKAIRGAVRIMQNSGKDIGKTDVTGMVRRPNLEFFDRVKQSLDDMIRKEENEGPTSLGKSYRDMRRRLMSELDDPKKVTDTYRQARQQYAGDLEVLDALKMGRDDFLHMSSSEFKELTKGMSYAEKDALRTGVAESLFTRLENTATEANPAKRVVGTVGLQNKLRQLFDSDKEYNSFVDSMSRESQMFDQGRRTLASGLSARTRDMGEHSQPVQDLVVSGGLAASTPGGMGTLQQPSWLARIGNTLSRTANPMAQKTVDDLADTLHSRDPIIIKRAKTELQKSLERLQKRSLSDRRRVLEGALVGGDLAPPSPHGYDLDEGDDGYASGGAVDSPGGIDVPSNHILTNLLGRIPPGSEDGYYSAPHSPSPGIPQVDGSVLRGMGTSRSRIDPGITDYKHYGEVGPEASFFRNNSVPDPRYVTSPVRSGAMGASGSAAQPGGSAGALATGLGLLSKLPELYKTASTFKGGVPTSNAGVTSGGGVLGGIEAVNAVSKEDPLGAFVGGTSFGGPVVGAMAAAGALGNKLIRKGRTHSFDPAAVQTVGGQVSRDGTTASMGNMSLMIDPMAGSSGGAAYWTNPDGKVLRTFTHPQHGGRPQDIYNYFVKNGAVGIPPYEEWLKSFNSLASGAQYTKRKP